MVPSSYATNSIPAQTYGNADFPEFGQAAAGVTYTSSNPNVATIVNGQIHITGAGTATITASNGSNSFGKTLTVNKAPLTVTANNASAISGLPLPALTVTYSGFVNGDTRTNLTTQPTVSTTAASASAAGNYPVTASGAASANYTFTYVPGTLVLAPSSYYTSALPVKTYGNADFAEFGQAAPGVTYSSSNTAVATIVNGNIHITGAGTSTITASNGSNSFGKTLTVNKAPLNITANNQTKVTGAANPALTVTYTGFVNGDTNIKLTTQPTISTTANTASPTGTYPITASGAVSSNYSFTYVAGTLTVTAPAGGSIATIDALEPQVNAAVTPNGDGKNDVLTISNIEKYPDNKFTLINTNGDKIYEASNYDNVSKAFDGHSSITGKQQQPGTYFYMLQYTDNGVVKSKSGYVVLKY
jgi:gliding motility-associated-like protein